MFKTFNIWALLLLNTLIFCLLSCTPPISPTPPLSEIELNYNKAIEEFKQIELIDTVNKVFKTCAISELSTAYYLPLYIGLTPKRIDLSERSYLELDSFYESGKYKKNYKMENLLIYVDTSRKIGIENRMYVPPLPPPPGTSNEDSFYKKNDYKHRKPTLYKSYTAFIKNNSDSFHVLIGVENIISFVVEAKDSMGNWKAVQKPYFRGCGYGAYPIYLPPQNILLSACPIYTGEYKTQMRLVMNRDYLNNDTDTFPPFVSNEFEGYINYGQFEHSDSTYKRRNVYCE